jgi:hypothetical protein
MLKPVRETGYEPRALGDVLQCHPCVPGFFEEHKNHENCTYLLKVYA